VSDAQSTPAPARPTGPLTRHHFLLRRLHSLTGIVPIGVFLIAHLVTNSSLAWGKFGLRGQMPETSITQGGIAYFQKEVAWINEQVPHLLLIEITLWASIAFHSVLGVVYAMSGRNNLARYPHQDNWRYALQRISGYIGIVFIFYHVATLRWGWNFLVPGGTAWSHHFSASTLAAALRGSTDGFTIAGLAVSLLYFVGITLLIFHFANGLWTAAITWGITISAAAQKRWGYVCAALGLGLMAAGWSALGAALLVDPAKAQAVETKILTDHVGPEKAAELIREKAPIPTGAQQAGHTP
jgi:succinate dehydrogenase / fumarate reductase cytochrome b subunit